MKYRLRLIATIEEAETPTYMNGGHDPEKFDWRVERLGSEFLFEKATDLYQHINSFAYTLGGHA